MAAMAAGAPRAAGKDSALLKPAQHVGPGLPRHAIANRAFKSGCTCGNNGGGDCDWCLVYHGYYEEDYFCEMGRDFGECDIYGRDSSCADCKHWQPK